MFDRRKIGLRNWIILLASVFIFSSCMTYSAREEKNRGPHVIYGQAGRTLPGSSLSIDANYDSRLDAVLPGYKLLPMVIKNTSLRLIPMDASKDRWVIVGEKGKTFNAVNTLRLKDPVAWRSVPDRIRDLIDYPEVIPINYSVTFDLLLPKNAELQYFKEMHFYSAVLGKKFVIRKEY